MFVVINSLNLINDFVMITTITCICFEGPGLYVLQFLPIKWCTNVLHFQFYWNFSMFPDLYYCVFWKCKLTKKQCVFNCNYVLCFSKINPFSAYGTHVTGETVPVMLNWCFFTAVHALVLAKAYTICTIEWSSFTQ